MASSTSSNWPGRNISARSYFINLRRSAPAFADLTSLRPISRGEVEHSHLCEATVDEQIDTCDEAAVLGCKEQYSGRDFLGATDASQRCRGGEPGAQLVRFGGGGNLTFDNRRVDGARADGIDADATVLQFDGPCASERANGCFCRAVGVVGR